MDKYKFIGSKLNPELLNYFSVGEIVEPEDINVYPNVTMLIIYGIPFNEQYFEKMPKIGDKNV